MTGPDFKEMPKRIQRQRIKGWRMPEGAVYVGRPTKWGNPFWHAQKYAGLSASLNCYRDAIERWNGPARYRELGVGPFKVACDKLMDWQMRFGGGTLIRETIIAELRGKDLACWCSLDQPCHADILLEIANP